MTRETKRVLMTGAAGQIGSELARALRAKYGDGNVVVTDIFQPAGDLAEGGPFELLDVTDAKAVDAIIGKYGIDTVYHLAALLSATGEKNPQKAWHVNMSGLYNVLEAARARNLVRVFSPSSIAVFGPTTPREMTPQDTVLGPTTMYGVTKVAGELLCAYYTKKFNVDCRGVRFPGLISAAMPGGGSSDYALFMYVDAVRKGGYEAFARRDTRIPLMYMPDGVRALLELAMADRERLTRSIYNIAAFSPRADEIATSVQRVIPDAKFSYSPDPRRQSILDSWPKSLDDTAARRDWGWKPKYDLDAMTDDLVPRVRRMLELGAILSSH